MYLSGTGSPQPTFAYYPETSYTFTTNGLPSQITGESTSVSSGALGSAPFIMTFDLNTPKVVGWSVDTAINSLDFQMRDCYGDLLYVDGFNNTGGFEGFSTEFQMTLLCVEREY